MPARVLRKDHAERAAWLRVFDVETLEVKCQLAHLDDTGTKEEQVQRLLAAAPPPPTAAAPAAAAPAAAHAGGRASAGRGRGRGRGRGPVIRVQKPDCRVCGEQVDVPGEWHSACHPWCARDWLV